MIYIIGGQTASGKSDLALEFARRIGGHIINGDAFQVYRNLDIGTAKVSKEERLIVPHHLFDIIYIDENFSIFDYQTLARKKIDELIAKNIPIVIVGGSGLYIRSVLFDYRFSNDVAVDMSKFSSMTDVQVHYYLKTIDAESAEKIHVNNRRRVLRAIEIYLQTGSTKTYLENIQNKHPYYEYTMIMLDLEKEELDDKIKNRVIQMFKSGLKEELNNLLLKYEKNAPGFRAIGYKEIIEHPLLTDPQLIDLISKNTIHYAKRQKTFFKNQFEIKTFVDKSEALQYLLTTFEENK